MKILPHNKEAYKKVKEAFKTSNRTCVIQPTGTGKSYIALQLVRDCADTDKILYLTSTKISRGRFISLVDKYALKKNITYRAYQAVATKEFVEKFDVIILDEFHRVGAKQWGRAVLQLLARSSNAKVLGLSATPIRYLENNRDMAEELFSGNVASEITLAQAIAWGLLPKPEYVTCLYSLQADYKKTAKMVERIGVEERKMKAKLFLAKAKSHLEQSTGLTDVFKEYIRNTSGKYLVFCKSINHLKNAISEMQRWLISVEGEKHIYRIDSSMSNSAILNEEKQFEEDNTDALKLLFCVDMFNEGYHLEGLDGVILLRPTVSANIYLQQIGRALSSGGSSPLILDIVRNIGCLSHTTRLAEDLKNCFKDGIEFDDIFTVYGYHQEFVDLLNEAQSLCVRLSPDEKCELIVEYITETGSTNIPAKTIYKELNIGEYAQEFRKAKKVGNIAKRIEKALNSVDFIWNVNTSRDEYIDIFKEYKAEKGHLNIVAKEVYKGYPVGSMKHVLKNAYVNGKLTPEEIHKFEEVGFSFGVQRKVLGFDKFCELYEQYIEEFNTTAVSTKTVYKGENFGQAVRSLRMRYSQGGLSKAQIEKLDSLGFVWVADEDKLTTDQRFEVISDYMKEHGTLLCVPAPEIYKGYPIGTFMSTYKSSYNKGELSQYLIDRLDAIDPNWKISKKEAELNTLYALLEDYKKEFGELDIVRSCKYKGVSLGSKIDTLKHKRNNGKLEPEIEEKLTSLGLVWDRMSKAEEYYILFRDYISLFGSTDFKFGIEEEFKGKNLRNAVQRTRRLYVTNSIPSDLISKFEALGFVWSERPRKVKK